MVTCTHPNCYFNVLLLKYKDTADVADDSPTSATAASTAATAAAATTQTSATSSPATVLHEPAYIKSECSGSTAFAAAWCVTQTGCNCNAAAADDSSRRAAVSTATGSFPWVCVITVINSWIPYPAKFSSVSCSFKFTGHKSTDAAGE